MGAASPADRQYVPNSTPM